MVNLFALFLLPCKMKNGDKINQHLIYNIVAVSGPVAQLNRAFDYGSKGFRFES